MPIGYNANQVNMPRDPISMNQQPMQQPMQQVPQMMGQTVQPLFPQPQGNVYMINSTLEVANVPVGAGMSIALCLPENVMYIKTMQNGNPLFYPYKVIPFNQEDGAAAQGKNKDTEESKENTLIEDLTLQIKKCNKRIEELENCPVDGYVQWEVILLVLLMV